MNYDEKPPPEPVENIRQMRSLGFHKRSAEEDQTTSRMLTRMRRESEVGLTRMINRMRRVEIGKETPKRMLNRMRRLDTLWKKHGEVEERGSYESVGREAKRSSEVPGRRWTRVGFTQHLNTGRGRVGKRAGGGAGGRWVRIGLVGGEEDQGWRAKRAGLESQGKVDRWRGERWKWALGLPMGFGEMAMARVENKPLAMCKWNCWNAWNKRAGSKNEIVEESEEVEDEELQAWDKREVEYEENQEQLMAEKTNSSLDPVKSKVERTTQNEHEKFYARIIRK